MLTLSRTVRLSNSLTMRRTTPPSQPIPTRSVVNRSLSKSAVLALVHLVVVIQTGAVCEVAAIRTMVVLRAIRAGVASTRTADVVDMLPEAAVEVPCHPRTENSNLKLPNCTSPNSPLVPYEDHHLRSEDSTSSFGPVYDLSYLLAITVFHQIWITSPYYQLLAGCTEKSLEAFQPTAQRFLPSSNVQHA